jgi:hypothetical protein
MKHLNSFLILAFLTVSLLTTKAQTFAVINPDNYKTKSTPYLMSAPSGSDFYLSIITGAPTYISVSDIDKGSGSFYKGTSPTKRVNGDTIQIIPGDPGNWVVTYQEFQSQLNCI